MRKHLEHFLLGTLWCLAVILGASFWFTIRFGFNIFSAENWRYFGQLQASGEPVVSSFYISIVIILLITMVVLHIIWHPKHKTTITQTSENLKSQTSNFQPQISDIKPTPSPVSAAQSRPPRLTIPTINTVAQPSTHTSHISNQAPQISIIDNSKLEQIFTDAGYFVKKPPKIAGLNLNLFAIGMDEVVWLGVLDTEPARLTGAIERLRAIFTETLEDIAIDIRPFILNPTTPVTDNTIKTFDSMDELRDYININKNRQANGSDMDDFDAYSEYIDTVANYFNKL